MDFVVSETASPGVVLQLDKDGRLPACAAGLGSKRIVENAPKLGQILMYDLASDAIVYADAPPSPWSNLVTEKSFKIEGLVVTESDYGPVLTSGFRRIADSAVLLTGSDAVATANTSFVIAYKAAQGAGTLELFVNGVKNREIKCSDGAHTDRYLYVSASAPVAVRLHCLTGSVEIVGIFDTLGDGIAVVDGTYVVLKVDVSLETYDVSLSTTGINYVGAGLNMNTAYYLDELIRFQNLVQTFPPVGYGTRVIVGDDVTISAPIKTDHLIIYARGKCVVNAPIDVSASCEGDGLFGGAGSLPTGTFASVGSTPVSYMTFGGMKFKVAENGTQPSMGDISSLGKIGLYESRVGQGSAGANVSSSSGIEWQAKGGGSVIIVAREIELNAAILATGEPGKNFSSIEGKANGNAGGGGGGVVLLRCLRLTRNPGIIDVSGYGNGWWGVMPI
jgi:hypothetical protein